MTERVDAIRERLTRAFDPLVLEIDDDSRRHAGHAGARDGRGHFNVRIVSVAFRDRTALERHRAVYAALEDLMQTDIHALAIDAHAPEEK